MGRSNARHMDHFAKLSPEALAKLQYLLRTRGQDMTARLLHTSMVTLENVSSSMGGARKDTIARLEKSLSEYVEKDPA